MKRIVFLSLLILSIAPAFGQSVVPLRGDSIRIYKQGGNAEIIVENASRSKTGAFLQNRYNGRLQFAYAIDSAYLNDAGDSIVFKRGNTSFKVKYPAGNTGGGNFVINDVSAQAGNFHLTGHGYLQTALSVGTGFPTPSNSLIRAGNGVGRFYYAQGGGNNVPVVAVNEDATGYGVAMAGIPAYGGMIAYNGNLYFNREPYGSFSSGSFGNNGTNSATLKNTGDFAIANRAGTAGRLATWGTDGTASELANGTNGDVLTMVAGLPTWSAPTGNGSSATPDTLTNLGTGDTVMVNVGANNVGFKSFTASTNNPDYQLQIVPSANTIDLHLEIEAPAGGGGSLVLDSITVSAAAFAEIDLTDYPDSYFGAGIEIEIVEMRPSGNGDPIYMRISGDGGSTFDAGDGHYYWQTGPFANSGSSGAPTDHIEVMPYCSNEFVSAGSIKFYQPSRADRRPRVVGVLGNADANGNFSNITLTANRKEFKRTDRVRIYNGNGGTINLKCYVKRLAN